IDKVEPNSPAAAAGLRPRDIIRGFNHTPIYNPLALLEYIKKHPDETLTLEVERNGSRFELPVKPVPLPTEQTEGKVKMQLRIGIAWDASGQMSIAHPSPMELIYNSVTSTLNTLGAVASPKSDIKLQHLSGPIGIGRIYYLFFVSERGWQLALWLSVVLNVNLAILNMLPIPVLDGGHILFGLIESIRRKPLNMRVLEVVQGVCTVLIIGAIAYISFFDGHGDVDPADDRIGERRLRDRADHRAGGEGRAQSRKYREGIARARLQRANRGRHPFQTRSSDGGGQMGRQSPDQSR